SECRKRFLGNLQLSSRPRQPRRKDGRHNWRRSPQPKGHSRRVEPPPRLGWSIGQSNGTSAHSGHSLYPSPAGSGFGQRQRQLAVSRKLVGNDCQTLPLTKGHVIDANVLGEISRLHSSTTFHQSKSAQG